MPRASCQLANVPAVAILSELHHVTTSDESYAVCFMSLMYMSPLIKVALGWFVTRVLVRELMHIQFFTFPIIKSGLESGRNNEKLLPII